MTVSGPFHEHPLRMSLIQELHNRPSEPLAAPTLISHLAVLTGEERGAVYDHLSELCMVMGVAQPQADLPHFAVDMGGFRLLFERHTEFCRYTVLRRADVEDPFADPAIRNLPPDWVSSIPGEVLGAVHVGLQIAPQADAPPNHHTSARDREAIGLRYFGGNPLVGGIMGGGIAEVYSDLRIHSDRFARILVRVADGASPRQCGRLVQRLMELHCYRGLSLLALPIAREASPKLRAIDLALSDVSGRLATQRAGIAPDADMALLKDLSELSAEVEALSARHNYRFAASEAYYDLVQQRLLGLREQKIDEVQTLTGFTERRLAPAMATCRSVSNRVRDLSERTARVGSLMRTRVEVDLLQQNKTVLEAMDRRAVVQLRLQEAVEGLSVVAISYYLVGLLNYLVKAGKDLGLGINSTVFTAIAVPIVFFTVWYGLRRAKKAMGLDHDGDKS